MCDCLVIHNVHRYGLWIILAGAIFIGMLIMVSMRMHKRKKWRKRALARGGSNISDRSLGRTSTVGFVNTFRRSFRSTNVPVRGVTLDGKQDEVDVEASGSGSPVKPVPTTLARITSNASQRTTTSVAETAEPVSGDESDGRGSAGTNESEDESDMQQVESIYRGMSKRLAGGKCKTIAKKPSTTKL